MLAINDTGRKRRQRQIWLLLLQIIVSLGFADSRHALPARGIHTTYSNCGALFKKCTFIQPCTACYIFCLLSWVFSARAPTKPRRTRPVHEASLAARYFCSGCKGQKLRMLTSSHTRVSTVHIHAAKCIPLGVARLQTGDFKAGIRALQERLRFLRSPLFFGSRRFAWFACPDSYSKCLSGHVIAPHER